MFDFSAGDLVPLMALSIPIVAIVGGISAGIVRMMQRQRALERAGAGERASAVRAGVRMRPRGRGQAVGLALVQESLECEAVHASSPISCVHAVRSAARARSRCVFTVFSGIPSWLATCSTDRPS